MPIFKSINKNFFQNWNSEMAYVVGFLMADGSMDVNQRGSQYFSIQITDKELLESIKKTMQSEHTISHRRGFANEKDRYRLQIGSKNMCNRLREIGIHEQKEHTMTIPDVPRRYMSHFVRGYFDGDGNVWMGQVHKERKTPTVVLHTTFTSCSQNFLIGLRKKLTEEGMGQGSLVFSRKAYRLQYSLKDSILLYQLMYKSVSRGLELPRKRKVFERYIKMRS